MQSEVATFPRWESQRQTQLCVSEDQHQCAYSEHRLILCPSRMTFVCLSDSPSVPNSSGKGVSPSRYMALTLPQGQVMFSVSVYFVSIQTGWKKTRKTDAEGDYGGSQHLLSSPLVTVLPFECFWLTLKARVFHGTWIGRRLLLTSAKCWIKR